jgi:hypothetical protein
MRGQGIFGVKGFSGAKGFLGSRDFFLGSRDSWGQGVCGCGLWYFSFEFKDEALGIAGLMIVGLPRGNISLVVAPVLPNVLRVHKGVWGGLGHQLGGQEVDGNS